jgi:Spy/CpxP family protein refolding chaperone
MKKLIAGLMVSACLTAPTLTLAQDHGGRNNDSFRSAQQFIRKLDISDEQKEQIKTIIQSARGNEETKENSKRKSKRNKNFTSTAVDLDPSSSTYDQDVLTMADEQAEKMKQRLIQMADIKKQIYAVLTYEQQEELKTLRAERAERRSSKEDTED